MHPAQAPLIPAVVQALPASLGLSTNLNLGQVRGLQERRETDTAQREWTIYAFHLEILSPDGTPLPPMPIEMRGRRFRGSLNEGDRVEVRGRAARGKPLRIHRLRNLTTGGIFKANADPLPIRFVYGPSAIIGWGLFILICGGFLYLLVSCNP